MISSSVRPFSAPPSTVHLSASAFLPISDHLMLDHVHMMISIPQKYAVSQVVGFIKGKSAIHLARTYGERKRNFVGQHFWAACHPQMLLESI